MQTPTSPSSSDPQSRSPVGAGPGVLVRFLRILSAPRDAFAPPRTSAMWAIPLILLVGLSTTQSIVLRDLALEAQRDRLADMNLSDPQKDAILDSLESGAKNATVLVTQSLVGGLFSVALWYLLPALLYLLGMNFGLGAKVRYGDSLGVTMLTGLLHFFRELIRLPIILLTGNLNVHTGPAALVDPSQRVLLATLARFDLFDMYRIFLLAVGFSVVTGLPARKTAAPVIAVWLLATIIFVGVYLTPLRDFIP